MTTVTNLRFLGFKIEDATVGTDLCLVWHEKPFRYYNRQFYSLQSGPVNAQKAAPDSSGTGFSMLTTNAWKTTMRDNFPFAFIMEESMLKIDEAQLGVDNLTSRIESLQAILRQLRDDHKKLLTSVTIV